MRPVPHDHRCLCGHKWDCMNAHCTDIEHKWCKRAECSRPESLVRLDQLETGGHMIHQVQHYLESQGEKDLAEQAAALRAALLARVARVAASLFAAEGRERQA